MGVGCRILFVSNGICAMCGRWHRGCVPDFGMHDIRRIIEALRRLNDLEAEPIAGWAGALTEREREIAIERAREGLPTSLLGHHDRLIARGKRSLAIVRNGVCGACHLNLPLGHRHPSRRGDDLDVCDNCGVFLEWAPVSATPEARVARALKGRARAGV